MVEQLQSKNIDKKDDSYYEDLTPGVGLISRKPSEFRVYRANKDLKGIASKWQLAFKDKGNFTDVMVFLVMSPQTGYDEAGNGKFDWEKQSITVKMGVNDLGEILAVLDGRKDSAGYKGSLYHETPGGGNKALKFEFLEGGNYRMSLSAQNANKERMGPYTQTLSSGEATVLGVLLKQAILEIHKW